MRTLYEHTTLRVTGSDMQGGLAKHDLVGEMAVGYLLVATSNPLSAASSCSRLPLKTLLIFFPHRPLTSIKTHLSAINQIFVSTFQQRYGLQEVNLLAVQPPQKLFSPQTSRASDNFQVCRNGQRTIAILPSGLLSVAKVL